MVGGKVCVVGEFSGAFSRPYDSDDLCRPQPPFSWSTLDFRGREIVLSCLRHCLKSGIPFPLESRVHWRNQISLKAECIAPRKRTQLVNTAPIRHRFSSHPKISRISSSLHATDSAFARHLPYSLCIFLLTSTGHMPQIDSCQQECSPKSFLFQDLSCTEGPLWHSHNSNGHDPCPGRFTGSRSLRSLPAGSIPHPQQQLPPLPRVAG